MSLGYIDSLTAQQLLCARITADMHTHITCCAHANQVLGGLFGNGVWSLQVLPMWLGRYYRWRFIGSSDAAWVILFNFQCS